jgi:DNA polymerase-1
MELRIAALLSGDPVMIEEYQRGVDRHAQQALLIWPDAQTIDEDWKEKRFAGKTLNFLVLYRGGARKFQETLIKDMGLTLPLYKCQEAISGFDKKYPHFRRWQNDTLELVRKQGYLVLPTGWSRTWSTGDAVNNVVSEIADFPIQTISAQLIQSGQFEIEKQLRLQRLRTKTTLQIHDALYFDGPMEEEEILDTIVAKYLTHPPLLDYLENLLGRSVPILYEKEIF